MENKEVKEETVEKTETPETIMYKELLQKSYAGIKFMLGSF